MSWETRNGKGSYYTRSRRIYGKVVREYIGTGLVAQEIAEIDALDREQRYQDRAKFKAEKEAQHRIDRKLDEEFKLTN